MSEPVFALLAAGGTGGHTYPAIALADVLVSRGHERDSIRFVGGRRGPEGTAVAGAGYAIDLLPGRGLERRLTPANLAVLGQALVALARAFGLVRRYRPRVVVGFGGYASLPCVVAARARGVPAVVHEQDAAPGLANRIATRLGARPATSLPGTALRGAVLTGNPVRAAIAAVERRPEEPLLVACFGGSLGSRTVNEAALGLYDRWRRRDDVAVHHVCGPRNLEECATRLAAARRPGDRLCYDLVPYEDRMDLLFGRAGLAVCRSGAGAVAELTAAGLPAVLVPLPGAPSDHQARNASALEEAGAAVTLPDDECDAARLDALLGSLLADPGRLAAMSAAALGLARPDAAERLADLVEGVARASGRAGGDAP